MIYLIVLFVLIILSVRYDIQGKTKYRDEWYLGMLAVFILIAGLRWRIGTDTVGYLYKFYHVNPYLENFSFKNYPIGKDPLYVLLNSIVKTLWGRFYVVQLIHASFVNILLFNYIKRHSQCIFTCIFFYAIYGYLGYNTEIMRASMSIVVCLYANDFILNKKWFKGYLLYFVALLFHAQTIVMFFTPFLFFLKLNRKGLVTLCIALVFGFFVQGLLGDYLELLEFGDRIQDKAEAYVESDRYGGSKSFNGILKIFAYIITALCCLFFLKKKRFSCDLLKLEPLMMLYMFFLAMNIGMAITYRYVDCYKIYAIFLFAEFFVYLAKDRRFSFGLSYCRAILFFSLLFVAIYFNLFNKKEPYKKYYPYTSIIDKTIDPDKEKKFLEADRSYANIDEY